MAFATILLVEDDPDIQEMLKFSLQSNDYHIYFSETAEKAWPIIESNKPDLVLLDWMLPGRSGIDLLRKIRKYRSSLPVIMLTARGSEEDRVLGLDVGADDYISKPFSVKELRSRIQAVLRRSRPELEEIHIGQMHMDCDAQRLKIGDKLLAVSPTEFKLLQHLMAHPERVYTRDQLIDYVWGTTVYIEDRTVDVHIRRLRKHLQPFNLHRLIQTVRGRGYRFSIQE